jgi:mRNA-degrading endonuclease YafQ of YafQ-DinJ toxin-antitoxin module
MSYILLRSTPFVRAARRFLKRNPAAAQDLQQALHQLSENPFHPALKSHRLKGALAGSWACSAGYDLRILFSFVRHDQQDAILLETLGTHDEVY